MINIFVKSGSYKDKSFFVYIQKSTIVFMFRCNLAEQNKIHENEIEKIWNIYTL